jgi:putative protein-disulfide isomerase
MNEQETLPTRMMWYFADPMCSWCWGFAPVLREIKQNYGEHLPIALLLGGLRPYTTQPLTAEQRDEILHHWQNVKKLTGQEFKFDGAMPDGFIYNTEPASRAVITIGNLKPDSIFAYLESIHRAFYVGQRDVTDTEVLTELASEQGVEEERFCAYFESDEADRQIRLHFERTRQAGVRGFPTLLLQYGDGFQLLTSGYQPYSELSSKIDKCLLDEPLGT